MTVKIIEEPQVKKCVCDKCKCTLAYEPLDIQTTITLIRVDGTETCGHITCPKCNNRILVSYS